MRVLAIDQTPKEKDGQNVVVGKTVTLELTPGSRDAGACAPGGTLSLALRSMPTSTRSRAAPTISDEARRQHQHGRFGVATQTTMQK